MAYKGIKYSKVCEDCRQEFSTNFPHKKFCGRKDDPTSCSGKNAKLNRQKWDSTNESKEYHREYDKKWRKENREKNSAYAERQREAGKKWREVNKEYIKEYSKKWRTDNLDKILFSNRQRMILKNSVGIVTFREWEELKKSYHSRCAVCHISESALESKYGKQFKNLTQDHIFPLKEGGLNIIENIWPLCVGCNSKKYAKIIQRNILYTGGTFDGIHIGHINLLKTCRKIVGAYGEVVVSLNTDSFIREYKGKPPLYSYNERLEQLLKCEYVTRIIPNIGNQDSKIAISAINPNFIVVGSDWAKKDYYKQMEFTQTWLDDHDIILIYVPYTEGVSTTILKERLLAQ